MEKTHCDLCGANDADTVYANAAWRQPVPDGLELVRCRQCGLMYLNPRPSWDEIGAYYSADYAPFRPAIEDERLGLMRWVRRRKLNQRRRQIEHYSGLKSGRILDVGCATGLFLHEMAHAGWEVAGVEPIASAADYARQRLHLDVFQGLLAEAPYPHRSFDVVTFWDVLEHTLSPTAELAHAASLLRSGGLLAINVPNWHSLDRRIFGPYWIGLDPPRHLYVFTRPTLTALLEKSGFRLLDWICFMPSYFAFIASVERWLTAIGPCWAPLVNQMLNLPGMRFVFEPWFALANWLKYAGVISVFARKEVRSIERE